MLLNGAACLNRGFQASHASPHIASSATRFVIASYINTVEMFNHSGLQNTEFMYS
jgi:hypothetical protein